MLLSLHIENIAVIRSLDMDFGNGFTVLSGETGAGKTVILDAVRLLLGARFERDLLRNGEEKALVSGIFSGLHTMAERLREIGADVDEDGCLMIVRTLTADGRSSVRLNGRSVTLAVLREVGALLCAIHGQNNTSVLLDTSMHRGILDAYAGTEKALADYRPVYRELCDIRRKIQELRFDAAEKTRNMETLRYQIADIEEISPKAGEEEKLEEKRAVVRNREKINRQAGFVYKALRGADKGSAHFLLSRSLTAMESLTDVLPSLEEYIPVLTDCLERIDDIAEEVYSAASLDDDSDPTELIDRIETRLEGYKKLKRKYGSDTESILRFYEDARRRLEMYETADDRLTQLLKKEQEILKRMAAVSATVTETRVSAARRLVEAVTAVLTELDMPKVRFSVSIRDGKDEEGNVAYTENGKDEIAFLVSANPGEEPKNLADAASGGELSRIMLAIKSVIAEKDGIPTVIYDEVDTGVSGKTARKIGLRLLKNAESVQILCITHSAQIAALADRHYHILKEEKNGRVETRAEQLGDDARIEELARILGGLHVTDVQRNAARALLMRTEGEDGQA